MKVRTKLWSQIFNFRLIILMIEDLPTEIYYFQKYFYFWKNTFNFFNLTCNKKKLAQKIENQASLLCAEFVADFKTVFVFILALIIFDFYSIEGSKKTFYRKGKCIYIYIYIYMHISRIIRGFWCYKCILSKDNWFLYDISAFMLYFIFYFFYKLDLFSTKFSIMISPRHVTSRICSPILMIFVHHM